MLAAFRVAGSYDASVARYEPRTATIDPNYKSWRRQLVQDPVLKDLADCESSSNPLAVNPMDTDGLKAYGLFQYKETTWEAFQEESGITGDIYSPHDQIKLTKWALAHGKASHWGICL